MQRRHLFALESTEIPNKRAMAGGGGKNSGLLKMEIEWDAKGKGGKSAKARRESRMILKIYSFLHLNLQEHEVEAESSAEIQTTVAQ
jgi:hypothetical protein